MPCWFCDRTGWVCENHVGRPWRSLSHRSDACACGTGARCACSRDQHAGPAPMTPAHRALQPGAAD